MGEFDYVMALVSIVIGLGLTHILSALGSAVHRVRGYGPPIHLEATYLLWVAFMLLWLVSFWWWEFKFKTLGTVWTFDLYLFVITYAVVLFLLVVVLVPRNLQGMDDSYAYFVSGRRWFFGIFLLANVIDIVDSLLKGMNWALRPASIADWALYSVAGVVGICAKRRSVQLGLAIAMLIIQLAYTWDVVTILGSW